MKIHAGTIIGHLLPSLFPYLLSSILSRRRAFDWSGQARVDKDLHLIRLSSNSGKDVDNPPWKLHQMAHSSAHLSHRIGCRVMRRDADAVLSRARSTRLCASRICLPFSRRERRAGLAIQSAFVSHTYRQHQHKKWPLASIRSSKMVLLLQPVMLGQFGCIVVTTAPS